MTQVNITLSEQEVLQIITGNRDESYKYLLEKILNEIMKAKSEEGMN